MSDDIVTRLRGSWDCSCLYIKEHGLDRKCLHCEAADEIERLLALLNNTLERENTNDVRQLEIVRKVEADRNRWRKWGEHAFTCPNKGINPCRECVSPATADAMNRVDEGGRW